MIVPIILGLATAVGVAKLLENGEQKTDSSDENETLSLDEIKQAEYKRGHQEASAAYEAENKRRQELEKAKRDAVNEWRLSQQKEGS